MEVPSHQMHRALNLYARRLERIAEARRRPGVEGEKPTLEIRRQSLVDRVAATIIQRIQEIGPRLGVDRQRQATGSHLARRAGETGAWTPEFRFHRIDGEGRKHLAALRIANGDFVFQRVEALARSSAKSSAEPPNA
jgi:hypothetical protein